MSRQTWTDEQPQDGDIVLLCEHGGLGRHHVFKTLGTDGQPSLVTRSDGTKFRSSWLMICEDCHLEALRTKQSFDAFASRDIVWSGDEPAVYKEEAN